MARVEARRFMQRHVAIEIFLAAQVRAAKAEEAKAVQATPAARRRTKQAAT